MHDIPRQRAKQKHHAAHNNGIKANNSAGNVRWASPHENNMDKHRHGTMKTGSDHHAIKKPECMPRGILHGNAKVNDADVIAIRSDNRPQTKIADQYGISQSLVSQIKRKPYGGIFKRINYKWLI
ncbi:hypothetical protein RAA17_12035 [Komagataeibacter rhaeticus]|nr:hypothetical protein [Komagataeibacter rhaeticus]